MDLYGHINNVSYFKYVQAARVNFWELIGLNELHRDQGIGPILIRTACDFRRPLRFPDTIRVETQVSNLGMHSFTLVHDIYAGSGALAAEAEDVILIYNYNEHQKWPVPPEVLEQLTSVRV